MCKTNFLHKLRLSAINAFSTYTNFFPNNNTVFPKTDILKMQIFTKS